MASTHLLSVFLSPVYPVEEAAISADIIQEQRNEWGKIRGVGRGSELGLRLAETIFQSV